MTRDEAIAAIREDARTLVAPEYAEEIAAAFGEHLGWQGRRTADFDRVTYAAETAELPSVSIETVARELARRLVPGYTFTGPYYHGRGMNAEVRAVHAADALAEHFARR